jgi:phosphotransferase system HPr (HPr) family protein
MPLVIYGRLNRGHTMKEFAYTVKELIGFHPGTATVFTSKMGNFSSAITIKRGKDIGNCKEFFSVMKLQIQKGQTITISAIGDDEEMAIREAQEYLSENL